MDDWRKIGIGLSTAGAFFTILGVLMFFDKALLAMGNVRASSDCCRCRKRVAHSCLPPRSPLSRSDISRPSAAALSRGRGSPHRIREDISLLLPDAQVEGHGLLLWRHHARAVRVGDDWVVRRVLGLSQPLQ